MRFLQILWLAWLIQAILAVLQVRQLARRLQRKNASPSPTPENPAAVYRPRAWVIVPFRGLEANLSACIQSLCQQDYDPYELVLVVDSKDDPAWTVLEQETTRWRQHHPAPGLRLLVAGPGGRHESQKIHNQLFALETIEKELQNEDVLVFVDSDTVLDPRWLARLIAPLRLKDRFALSTTYRWLIPEPPPGRAQPAFWSHLASVMNSSVACLHRNYWTDRAWGGAMALRVETARQADLKSWLRGALTDDHQLTRLVWRLGKRIAYLPTCLVASPVSMTLPQLINFARRQYLITRVYLPVTYLAGLSILTLWVAGFASAWGALIAAVGGWRPTIDWRQPLTVIVLVAAANQIRSYYRSQVIRYAFGPAMLSRLRTTLAIDRWLTPLWMIAHWLLALSAALGRTICWRGIRYRLRGPQDVERLD